MNMRKTTGEDIKPLIRISIVCILIEERMVDCLTIELEKCSWVRDYS